ncbi:2,3-bisphosphoglycerate-independent phosphoglycerate mutase [Alphaproteobacteria bacterium]|nr:2,3-bisphosphoglycerate-independent phosphoglycerate mutase [Alphaproteobacteria bacterium]
MRKVLLCILDGWGLGKKNKYNAIEVANTENFDAIAKKFDMGKLYASEKKVGLPIGQFGNSEVGHMNIGSGRIILQDILRIDKSLKNGNIENNFNFLKMLRESPRVHLLGILSSGGVHGHQDHLFKILEILGKKKEVLLHCFLDGRDSSPVSGYNNMSVLMEKIKKKKNIKIASICGRFYSMDRDNRWDRINLAYKAIIEGSAEQQKNPLKSIKESYAEKITDEFFKPKNFSNYSGVKKNDGFFITNYRADRVRELLTAIFDKQFNNFKRNKIADFSSAVSMVEYSKRLKKKITPLIQPLLIENNLGEILSKKKLNQLRIAETEKYAHVTYFFNGGVEESYEGEDRVLIPSPRVETYDQSPEMSALELTDELINRIKKNKYNLIVTNFANTDMVGHTGNFKATIKAVETVDSCIGKILEQCKKNGYTLIITSDHGNADLMYDEKKSIPCTTHSINPVPFIICEKVKLKKKEGILADIAPTILDLMKLEKPDNMNGCSLLK